MNKFVVINGNENKVDNKIVDNSNIGNNSNNNGLGVTAVKGVEPLPLPNMTKTNTSLPVPSVTNTTIPPST